MKIVSFNKNKKSNVKSEYFLDKSQKGQVKRHLFSIAPTEFQVPY